MTTTQFKNEAAVKDLMKNLDTGLKQKLNISDEDMLISFSDNAISVNFGNGKNINPEDISTIVSDKFKQTFGDKNFTYKLQIEPDTLIIELRKKERQNEAVGPVQDDKLTRPFWDLMTEAAKMQTRGMQFTAPDIHAAGEVLNRFTELNAKFNILKEDQVRLKANSGGAYELVLFDVTKEQKDRAYLLPEIRSKFGYGPLTDDKVTKINEKLDYKPTPLPEELGKRNSFKVTMQNANLIKDCTNDVMLKLVGKLAHEISEKQSGVSVSVENKNKNEITVNGISSDDTQKVLADLRKINEVNDIDLGLKVHRSTGSGRLQISFSNVSAKDNTALNQVANNYSREVKDPVAESILTDKATHKQKLETEKTATAKELMAALADNVTSQIQQQSDIRSAAKTQGKQPE